MLLGGRSSPMLLGCLTSCIGAQSPAVELVNAIQFRLRSDPLTHFMVCQGLVVQLQIVSPFWSSFPLNHVRAWSVNM